MKETPSVHLLVVCIPLSEDRVFGVFRVTLKIKLPLYSVHLAGRGKKQTGDKKKSG
jgi:hypothetical protein